MKVVFVGNDKSILTGSNGDSHLRHKEYAKHFDELVIIIFSLEKDRLFLKTDGNLTLIPTNSKNRWFYLFDSLKILSRLGKVNLISTQDPFIAGLVGVIAKLLWKSKLNIQIHNIFFSSPYFRQESLQNHLFYWLGKFCLLFANSTRVVNSRQVYGHNRFLAPVAADLDFFLGKPHKTRFNQVVCVARLAKQKNLPLLFKVAHNFPNLKFIVVGEGEEREPLEKIKPNNVFLVGQKNRKEVKKIYAQSDVFILPSNYEGYAITVMEALASGLPIIMTDTGCAQSLIVNRKIGGFVVPIGDSEKLTMAIKELLDKPKTAQQLVLRGQKLLRQEYRQANLIKLFISGLKKTL